MRSCVGGDDAVFVDCGYGGVILGQEGEDEGCGTRWEVIEGAEGERA